MSAVLITGGSRGIGAACVRRFAASGHQVSFIYEKEHQAASVLAEETGSAGYCADVADPESVQRVFQQVGPLDILVCNAGISKFGLMNAMSIEDWNRIFAVNVTGMYHCINASMPGFLQKQCGSIVTVSSMWGQVGASCEAAYSATKGAVISMSKALAKELGPSGIRVNCVAPGVILTDMCSQIDPEILQQLQDDTPIGRNGHPDDVAQAIEFLALAPFITGQVLGVNGGYVI